MHRSQPISPIALTDTTDSGEGSVCARDRRVRFCKGYSGESAVCECCHEIMVGDDDDAEESANLRTAASPDLPSQAEIERHRCSHIPFRRWCRDCIRGRALGERRGRFRGREHAVPIVGIDYFFVTADGQKVGKRGELEFLPTDDGDRELNRALLEGRLIKCLIVRCHETKMIFVHVVPCKGVDADGLVVEVLKSDLAWLGHVKLILKSDNEPALKNLIERAMLSLRIEKIVDNVSSEHSTAHDSQANGGTEIGVRLVRDQFRSMRSCIEGRLGRTLPATHPVTAWMLEHAAFLRNILAIGDDGLTAWNRARGRDHGLDLYEFGETILYKLPGKGAAVAGRGNMAMNWEDGVFLGYRRDTLEYVIATADGVTS